MYFSSALLLSWRVASIYKVWKIRILYYVLEPNPPQGRVLFNTFINDLGNGPMYTLSKCTDNSNWKGVAAAPAVCASNQRDLGRGRNGLSET